MGLLVCEGKSVRVCSREGAMVESTHVRVVGYIRCCCLLLAIGLLQWITLKRQLFPVLRKRRVKKSEVQVYRKCRMPELPGEQLIECTNCKEWYHLDACIDVASATCLDSSVP